MEFGDVFSTGPGGPGSPVWTHERTVLGTRVIGFVASQGSLVAGVCTDGSRLASPGLLPDRRDRPRLDRDAVRWFKCQSVRYEECDVGVCALSVTLCTWFCSTQTLTGAERDVATEFGAAKVPCLPACTTLMVEHVSKNVLLVCRLQWVATTSHC